MDSRFVVRLGIAVGLLTAMTVLMTAYYGSKWLEKKRTSPGAIDDQRTSDDQRATVTRMIREATNQPNAKVEILRWWPPEPRNIPAMVSGFAGRVIYRVGDAGPVRDAVFAIHGDQAALAYNAEEGAESHRLLDEYFACENCKYGPSGAAKDELRKLEGVWVVREILRDPLGQNGDQGKGTRWDFKGDKLTAKLPERDKSATFSISIDATKETKTIDLRGASERGPILGFYQFIGNNLRICCGPPGKGRPRDYELPPASGYYCVVLVRE